MAVSGHQDFWQTGSRLRFKRDTEGATAFPWRDLGVIQAAQPTMDTETVELDDTGSGIAATVATGAATFNESYDIVCSNMSLENSSLLMLGSAPAAFTQSATEVTVDHTAYVDGLLHLHDDDDDQTEIYNVSAVAGVYSGGLANLTAMTVTAIDASARTITVTEDASSLSDGDCIIVQSTALTDVTNSRTYTVASVSGTGPTTITVDTEPADDESSISGAGLFADTGDTGVIYEQGSAADWVPYDLGEGFIKIPSGSSISDASTVSIVFTPAALTGNRLITPQQNSSIEGKVIITWNRGGDEDRTVRECRCSITPASTSLGNEEFSNMTLTFKVLQETGATYPNGRVLHFKGSVPTRS